MRRCFTSSSGALYRTTVDGWTLSMSRKSPHIGLHVFASILENQGSYIYNIGIRLISFFLLNNLILLSLLLVHAAAAAAAAADSLCRGLVSCSHVTQRSDPNLPRSPFLHPSALTAPLLCQDFDATEDPVCVCTRIHV